MNHDLCRKLPTPCAEHCGLTSCIYRPSLREGARNRLNALPTDATHALRVLRVWHYRHALTAARRQHDMRASRHTLTLARQSYSFHMAALIALNDLFPVGDDVENDARTMSQADEVLSLKVPA